MIGITSADLLGVLPELILFGGAMLILMLDAFAAPVMKRAGVLVTSMVLFGGLIALEQTDPTAAPAFGVLMSDGLTFLVGLLVIVSAFLVAMLSWGYLERNSLPVGEFMAGLLTASGGMVLISRSGNLMVIFVALEILSIALYMMTAYARTTGDGVEAGLKYFILGAFASAIFIFGAALIYGATGSMTLSALSVRDGALLHPLYAGGLVLLIAGLGFKISAVPFHMWTPDVYQGAPTPVTAFLASASKVAGVAALLRVVYPAFGADWQTWGIIWSVLAVLTMTVGNVIALVQDDVKRVLAYSSIAHVGFILMALLGSSQNSQMDVSGAEAALFYLLTYVLAAIGSFGVLSAMPGDENGRVDFNGLRGLGASHPWLAGLMALFVLSLAGVPPLIGFSGKLFAFRAVLGSGAYVVAVAAALNSALAFYYYLRIVVSMYMESRSEPLSFAVPQMVYPRWLSLLPASSFWGFCPAVRSIWCIRERSPSSVRRWCRSLRCRPLAPQSWPGSEGGRARGEGCTCVLTSCIIIPTAKCSRTTGLRSSARSTTPYEAPPPGEYKEVRSERSDPAPERHTAHVDPDRPDRSGGAGFPVGRASHGHGHRSEGCRDRHHGHGGCGLVHGPRAERDRLDGPVPRCGGGDVRHAAFRSPDAHRDGAGACRRGDGAESRPGPRAHSRAYRRARGQHLRRRA